MLEGGNGKRAFDKFVKQCMENGSLDSVIRAWPLTKIVLITPLEVVFATNEELTGINGLNFLAC